MKIVSEVMLVAVTTGMILVTAVTIVTVVTVVAVLAVVTEVVTNYISERNYNR